MYRKETVAVKSLPPNAWGFYEMHGNVWEWCADGMREYRDQEECDPVGQITEVAHCAMRGGSWIVNAGWARSAYRFAPRRGFVDLNLGFRLCLRSIEPSQAPGRREGRAGASTPSRDEAGSAKPRKASAKLARRSAPKTRSR